MSILIKKYILEKFINKTKYELGTFLFKINDSKFSNYINFLQTRMKKLSSKSIIRFEKELHITLIGGIKDKSKENIKEILQKIKLKPFDIEIDELSMFQNSMHDVIILKCNSKKLDYLNKVLSEIPHIRMHSEFIPHITVGYVKSGTGKKFLEKLKPTFKKGTVKVDLIYYTVNRKIILKYKLK